MVIERYKSGFEPPGDIPFDDLSRSSDSASHTTTGGNTYVSSTIGAHRSDSTIKGTMSANKIKKRIGIFALFSSNKVCMEIN